MCATDALSKYGSFFCAWRELWDILTLSYEMSFLNVLWTFKISIFVCFKIVFVGYTNIKVTFHLYYGKLKMFNIGKH